MADTQEMRDERARLIKRANEIQDRALAADRTMTAEEQQEWDQLMNDADALEQTFVRLERMADVQARMEESQEHRREISGSRPRGERADNRPIPSRASNEDRLLAFQAWMIHGSEKQAPQYMREAAQRCGIDVYQKNLTVLLPEAPLGNAAVGFRQGKPVIEADALDRWSRDRRDRMEQRQQSVGTGSAGGFTVADEMIRELEVALLRFGGMRQVAQVFRTDTGADMPWPTMNDTTNEGRLLGENTQVTQTDLVFAQTIMNAYKYSSDLILASVEFLQDSSINVSQVIGAAAGTRIGRITNRHFTVGTGSGQPNGIVTAAVSSVTGATLADGVQYNDLIDLEHSVDPDYRVNARWMFNDLTLRNIKKLRDDSGATAGTGRPLWLPGLAVREPDTILGYPYTINQHVPLPSTASAKSIVFGDLMKYKIRDVREITLLRLDERYADFHQVAFLAFSRHDGDLIDAGTNPVKAFTNAAT